MASAPYGVRLIVGAAVTVVEETRRLPQTVLMYPMTLASSAAQLVMRVQQDLAVLVVKGDAALENLFPPKDDQPEWATFDEDLGPALAGDVTDDPDTFHADAPPARPGGRFALYSEQPGTASGSPSAPPGDDADVPDAVRSTGYSGLTLAQLRARLTSLSLDDLDALLTYEIATRKRAPFQTLLADRITRVTTK